MNHSIRAIFFDVGGTLRTGRKYPQPLMDNIREIMKITGLEGDPGQWMERFTERYRKYYAWGTMTLLELTEAEMWSQWLLPEAPAALVSSNAARLNQLWRDAKSQKVVLNETVPILKELSRRGYRLGIISNTSSSTEVPHLLNEAGITDLIETVVITNKIGRRKPHPLPFLIASKELGIDPSNAAYIGNRPSRDVVGAKEAGIAEVVVIINDGNKPENECTPQKPDYIIHNLKELLDIYPDRHKKAERVAPPATIKPLFDCSISTMWGIDQHEHFNDFFLKCRDMGIARYELNHQVTQSMLDEIDLNQFHINSLHEPCPAEISLVEMDRNDWMISSTDEDKRSIAVNSAKRTIDQAVTLGCRYIVVHPGTTGIDHEKEKQLRSLFDAGEFHSPEYKDLQEEYVALRKRQIEPHLESCKKSLKEIGTYALASGIAVGLENRYHYYDIPLPDELQILLNLFEADGWGFIYDVGHARTLDRLGFVKHAEWIERFGSRMIGTHLHDVIGLTDHQAPGTGELDFNLISRHLPVTAFRVLEVAPTLTPEQILSGLEFLADHGCISKI